MCVSPLTVETLERLQYFKYNQYDYDSVVDTFVLFPIIIRIMKKIKRCAAPHIIMIIVLYFYILSFFLTAYDGDDNFYYELNGMTCLFQAIIHLFYLIMGNVIRIQLNYSHENSNGNDTTSNIDLSSICPYDYIIKRVCETFIVIMISFTLHHLLMLGNEGIFSIMTYFTLYLGFYTAMYEEYILQEISTVWYFNKTSEGLVLLIFTCIITGVSSSELWESKWIFSLSEWIMLILLLFSITGVIWSFIYITRKKGLRKILLVFIDWIMIYNIFLVPIFFIYFNEDFYSEYLWLIILTISLLFARNAIGLQFAICLKQILSYKLDLIVVNILLLSSILFTNNDSIILMILACVCVILGTQITGLLVIRSIEIIKFLQLSFWRFHPSITSI